MLLMCHQCNQAAQGSRRPALQPFSPPALQPQRTPQVVCPVVSPVDMLYTARQVYSATKGSWGVEGGWKGG